ncbi:MAG: phytase [Rhodospirillaceae bacterium]|nr:phytase [Rhodospirillaceae bacterium]
MSAALAACDDKESRSDSKLVQLGAGVPVPAAGETEAVATQSADAADDPEIWVDARNPQRGVIFGTDKQAGLYYYDLNGKILGFIPDGRLNNVDLRDGFATPEGPRVLIVASDRGRMGAALYLMNPDSLEVKPWAVVPLDLAEPYGACMGKRGDDFIISVNSTDGAVRQVKIGMNADGSVNAAEERRFKLATQVEGCVIDDAKGQFYIGEEGKGIWRYAFDTAGDPVGTLIAPAPSDMLQPDVEGLALLREGAATYLIASSQGDSAFAVWRVDGDAPMYQGRFSVAQAHGVDAVTGTDGVAALGGAVGAFPNGLIVMQDDVDVAGETGALERKRQNFKWVDWRAVKQALKIGAQEATTPMPDAPKAP